MATESIRIKERSTDSDNKMVYTFSSPIGDMLGGEVSADGGVCL